jgi:methylated-DNA-[protein]-cysteine S-methyltransferase
MGLALFDTALGRCGLAWGAAGMRAVAFPGRDDAETLRWLKRHAPEAEPAEPPAEAAQAIAAVQALLAGEARDLTFVRLDYEGLSDFQARVYDLIRKIPSGETRTYGELARELGDVALARAVGEALGRNPFPIIAPCHRVLAANGGKGGFTAPGGTDTKLRLLEIEGAFAPERLPLFGG